MAVNLSMFAGVGAQLFDNNGVPLSGGKLYSYTAGTTTPQATYTTSAGNVAHTNPIVLDSAGRVSTGGEIWLTNAVNYKFVVKTSADVTIATYDNVSGNGSGVYDNILARLAESDGSSLIGYTQTGTGAVATTVEDALRRTVNAEDFGAIGDGTTDNTTAIQAAIDAVFTAGGGTVFFPAGNFVSGPLTLKYRVSLSGISPTPFTEMQGTWTGTKLKLKAASTAPLITTDKVNGPVRNNSPIGVGSQRYQNSYIQNMQLDGNLSNQTSPDADIIQAFQVWNFTIQNCALVSSRGFGLRALDCNVLSVINCGFVFAPVYLESLADSLFSGNQMGGGNLYAWPVIWMPDATSTAWQNLFQDNLIFNNSNNTTSQSFTYTVDTATDVLTTSGTHGWVTGTPIIVETSGTVPAGLSLSKVYYVTVVSSTTVKLSLNRALVAAGTFVDITTAGTGTQTIQMGGNAGIYLNGVGVKWNKFSGNRVDQCYGHGFFVNGSTQNTINNNIINLNGLGNATGQYGIFLTNAASSNQMVGNNIDGTVSTSGGNTSNQTVGVYASADSTSLTYYGNRVENHPVANQTFVSGNGTIFVPMKAFTADTGTPAITIVGGGRRNVLAFDAAAQETADAFIQIPPDWQSAAVAMQWVNVGAGAGDVVWRVQVLESVLGSTLNAPDNIGGGTGVTATALAQDIVNLTYITNLSPLSSDEILSIRVSRMATSGSDTLANDAGLIGLLLTRV